MSIDFKLEGMADLEKALLSFGKEFGGKQIRAAVRDSSKPTLTRMKQYAPRADEPHFNKALGKKVLGGRLRRNLRIRTKVLGNSVFAFVGYRGKEIYYVNWAEFGTAPHWLNKGASARKGTEYGKGRGTYNAKRKHPGAKPSGFAQRAFDATRETFLREFHDAMKTRVDRAAKAADRV